MPTREQLTNERLDALIRRLEDGGVIDSDMSEAMQQNRNFGEAGEAVERKRNGKDPREATGRE